MSGLQERPEPDSLCDGRRCTWTRHQGTHETGCRSFSRELWLHQLSCRAGCHLRYQLRFRKFGKGLRPPHPGPNICCVCSLQPRCPSRPAFFSRPVRGQGTHSARRSRLSWCCTPWVAEELEGLGAPVGPLWRCTASRFFKLQIRA